MVSAQAAATEAIAWATNYNFIASISRSADGTAATAFTPTTEICLPTRLGSVPKIQQTPPS
jgi:hypothetical protein